MTIAEIKESLSVNYLGGMPPAKMRLKCYGHSVLKDNFSLARYNVNDGTLFEMKTKERGGRK